jgi:antitoxin component of RelBE/YafQ-DinJ toxin-antitoxin module
MAGDQIVRARIDLDTKERATEAVGLSISDAIRLLMLRIADEQRLPRDFRDLHIEPDWLLIYRVENDELHLHRIEVPITCNRFPSNAGNKKARQNRALSTHDAMKRLEAEAAEALVELRKATAAVHQLLVAAGPGWMGLAVNFEVHDGAFSPPGRAGLVFGAVGHDHIDHVVFRVNVRLHNNLPAMPGSICRNPLRQGNRLNK